MSRIIEATFLRWTQGKSPKEARIAIFNHIRNIPYAVIPELNGPERYVKMLELNKGSCMPKHFLLCSMFQKLGLLVLYVVYPYRWDEFEGLYPPKLKKLAGEMPTDNHLACKVEIEGKLVLIDATLDPPLAVTGLAVTKKWDGVSDTLLPISPHGEEQVYHPSEANLMQVQQTNEMMQSFYSSLNSWLELLRIKNSRDA